MGACLSDTYGAWLQPKGISQSHYDACCNVMKDTKPQLDARFTQDDTSKLPGKSFLQTSSIAFPLT